MQAQQGISPATFADPWRSNQQPLGMNGGAIAARQVVDDAAQLGGYRRVEAQNVAQSVALSLPPEQIKLVLTDHALGLDAREGSFNQWGRVDLEAPAGKMDR
jgi:hypothetical protein